MDIKRISNQNSINETKITPKELSFTGHKVVEDNNGNKQFRIYLPQISANNVDVEIVSIHKDANGNVLPDKVQVLDTKKMKSGEKTLDFSLDDIGMSENDVIGYKFIIDGKDYVDTALKANTKKGQYNILPDINRAVMNLPRTMYHIMPSCFNPDLTKTTVKGIDGKSVTVDLSKVSTNHFNKYDARLNNITAKIDDIADMGFKRIITTPLFGQDNVSTHGYWTTNPYQVTSELGTDADFEKFQTELFKKGMAWVADGAFVNEGIEGVHLRDILKHGPKSPYADWLELHNFPNEPLKLGVLPLNEKAYKNYDTKIINSPLVWDVDKNGKPTEKHGCKNLAYDSTKPTYVQLLDRRLVSEEQFKGQELIRSYAIKNLDDKNDVKTYMDAVQPYSFEVSPKAVEEKFARWTKDSKPTDVEFKSYLKDWDNFSFAPSSEDGGSTLWVGNKDIAKLRFMITEGKEKLIRDSYHTKAEADERIVNVHRSIAQVQDNIVQVGEYWTDRTAKLLTVHTAGLLKEAKTPEEFQAKIEEAIGKGKLPKTAKALSDNVELIKNLLDTNGYYNQNNFPMPPSSVEDGLMQFPLEAIGFSPELISIVGSPYIKKLAVNKEEIGLSRYEILEQKGERKEFPAKFKATYDKMNDIYKSEMQKAAVGILKAIDETRSAEDKLLNKDGSLSENNAGVYRLISDDIAKFLIVKALNPEISVADYTNPEKAKEINQKISEISCKKLNIDESTPEIAANGFLRKLKTGIETIKPQDIQDIAAHLSAKTKNVDGKTILVSQLLIDKTESGLEWRIDAAKDVSDMEALDTSKAKTNEIADTFIKFWSKFNKGVHKYNPRAYKIGELTDEKMIGTSGKYKNAGDIVKKFVENGGFTTPTNYNYLYSTLHSLFGSMPEKGDGTAGKNKPIDILHEKMLSAWAGTPGFLFSGPQDSVLYSHVSPGNHDKPRALHGFALNTNFIYTKSMSETNINELVSGLGENSSIAKDLSQILKLGKTAEVKTLQTPGLKGLIAIFDKTVSGMDGYKYKSLRDKLEWIAKDRLSADEIDRTKIQKTWLYTGLPKFADNKVNLNEYFECIEQLKKATGKTNPKEAIQLLISSLTNSPEYNQSKQLTDDLFKKIKPDGIAMASAIAESLGKAAKELQDGSDKHLQTLVKAVEKVAEIDRGEFFAIRPFEQNFEDIIKEASKNEGFREYFEQNGKKLEAKTHEIFIKPAFERYTELMKVAVALPGNPTNYAGEELGETGAETKSKNVYRQNRNRLHWERVGQDATDPRAYIQEYKDNLSSIWKLRGQKALSPLVNGATIVLQPQEIDKKTNAFGLYRYNDETDVIAIFQNKGLGSERHSHTAQTVELKEIVLNSKLVKSGKGNDENTVNKKDNNGNTVNENEHLLGLPFKLTNAEYVNAFEDDGQTYEVNKDGNIVNKDGVTPIKIKGSTLILRRKKDFKGREFTKEDITFTGNQNKQVAIANLRYNIPVSNNSNPPVSNSKNKMLLSV